MSSPILPVNTHTQALITPPLFTSEEIVYRPEHLTIQIDSGVVDGWFCNGMVYLNGARSFGAW